MECARFLLKHPKAVDATPFGEGIAGKLSSLGGFHSNETFNQFCRAALEAWNECRPPSPGSTENHSSISERIKRGEEGSIPTSWGGVFVCSYLHPKVEKFLVIKKGGYLAFEKHDEKVESLTVREGAGILLYRLSGDDLLSVEVVRPGFEITLQPGEEHCLIGTEDLLVFERSIDPKGMDQDLVFVFTPEPK